MDVYPQLVLNAVDDEEMAKPLSMAPSEASRVIDGRQLSLEDPPTLLATATLTVSDMHSPMVRHGGAFWYRDCTLSVILARLFRVLKVVLSLYSKKDHVLLTLA